MPVACAQMWQAGCTGQVKGGLPAVGTQALSPSAGRGEPLRDFPEEMAIGLFFRKILLTELSWES